MNTIPADNLDTFLDGETAKLPTLPCSLLDLENVPSMGLDRPPSPKLLQGPRLSTTTNTQSDDYVEDSDEKSPPTSPSSQKPSLFSSPSSLFNLERIQSKLQSLPHIQSTIQSSIAVIQHSASGLWNQTEETTKLCKLPPTPEACERQQRIQQEVEYARQFVTQGPNFSIIRPLYTATVTAEAQHLKLPSITVPNPLNLLRSNSDDQNKPSESQSQQQPQQQQPQPKPLTPEELAKQKAAAALLKRRMEEVKLMEKHEEQQAQYRLGFSPLSRNKQRGSLSHQHDDEIEASPENTDDLSSLSHDLQKRLNRARGIEAYDLEADVDDTVQRIISSYNVSHSHLRSTPPISPTSTSRRIEESSSNRLFITTDPLDPYEEVSPVSQPFASEPAAHVVVTSPLDKLLQAADDLHRLQRKQSTHTSIIASLTASAVSSSSPSGKPNYSPSLSTATIDPTQADHQLAQTTSCDEDFEEEEFEQVEGFSLFAL